VVFAVYVTPEQRGGKVLAELIEAVAAWSRASGRERLMLEVVEGNGRAVRAYEKLGFEDTGERVPHPVLRSSPSCGCGGVSSAQSVISQ
jgi:GNAT superfamily N-acetyltransferase